MAAEEEHATHAWSEGASRGAHTLKLDSLADGQTRLVKCSPLRDDASGAPISRDRRSVVRIKHALTANDEHCERIRVNH